VAESAPGEVEILECERLAEKLHISRLSNGLPVYVLPKPGFLKKYAILAVRFGSCDLEFQAPGEPAARAVPAGIAHFLEHKLFEEEGGGNAFDRFSKNGAYCNAYTSYTTTAYLFSCTDLFAENLALLVDFVGQPVFTEAAIAREREIISQEIRMYEDSPDWRGFQGLLESLYERHPVRIDITGTIDSISQIGKADLERCYRAFYRPSNMVLFAAGELEPMRVVEVAERAFAARRYPDGGGELRRVRPDEPPGVRVPEARMKLDISQPRLLVGWKDPRPDSGRNLLRKDVEVAFAIELIYGRSSTFYERAYEGGLIDSGFAASYTAERDHGYVALGGETDDPDRLRSEVAAAAERALREGFAAEDFARIRNKALGKFLRNFNSLEYVAASFVQGYFLDVDFFEYLPAIEQVEPEAVLERARAILRPDLMAASIVEPIGR
jgi:predicted Zn-dependent peptidase